jgi:hypothetical protein
VFEMHAVSPMQVSAVNLVVGQAPVLAASRAMPVITSLLLLAMCNTVGMSVNVSVRLDDRLAERLRLRARAAGESLSDRLRRYAEEGARRDEHPMITFRDGPTGRRAGLIGGPDVWEATMWIEDIGPVKDPAAELTTDGVLSRPQIDAALAYRAAYPDEINARIELHRSETAAVDAR